MYQCCCLCVLQDLVLWASLGLHHIPHREDFPVTPTVGKYLELYLMPWGFEPRPMLTHNLVVFVIFRISFYGPPWVYIISLIVKISL